MVNLYPNTIYYTIVTLLGFKFTDLVTVLGYPLSELAKNSRVFV